jgi:hypothetical protein
MQFTLGAPHLTPKHTTSRPPWTRFQGRLGPQADTKRNPKVIGTTNGTRLTQGQQDAMAAAGFEEEAVRLDAVRWWRQTIQGVAVGELVRSGGGVVGSGAAFATSLSIRMSHDTAQHHGTPSHTPTTTRRHHNRRGWLGAAATTHIEERPYVVIFVKNFY